ncbi:hypothetical protein IAQ61_002680 [Plenodomus lingam]|uniref:Predicted protein n=1 Tax=Leptosphaeria maculans (strain JN3 / isolate v23.1.3 / race Av1-4-5-6-7-8) TaxID=985895 RepID=E5A930_LEPMJ|nr:predicted protein [Plenodomus lingam JN3]KAH9877316.1 hypothetical protein IAQ61_002680 [Plenodomus lingam]CBY00125.1 predicted protein [Plenodomus lingam JN3]
MRLPTTTTFPILFLISLLLLTPPTLAKSDTSPNCGARGKCTIAGELRCEQNEDGRWISRCDGVCRVFLKFSNDCNIGAQGIGA